MLHCDVINTTTVAKFSHNLKYKRASTCRKKTINLFGSTFVTTAYYLVDIIRFLVASRSLGTSIILGVDFSDLTPVKVEFTFTKMSSNQILKL